MGKLASFSSNNSNKEVDDGIWDLKDVEEKLIKASQWGMVGAKMYKAFPSTHNQLPSGCYSITEDRNDGRSLFMNKLIKSDEIMRFGGDLSDNVLSEINDFWNREKLFKDNGFLHKRGYLLYGPQGTGKSSIVWQVADNIIKNGGIVFVCDNPKFFTEGLKTFRQAEPDRPVVCVFEDIDAIIAKYGDTEILSLLDGDSQINRVVNIATTNYPERLDARIANRPRRFDRIHKIIAPTDDVRLAFLKKKLPKKSNYNVWLKETKELSFASLAECIISVICLGNDLKKTAKILREMETGKYKSDDFNTTIGFNGDEKGDNLED